MEYYVFFCIAGKYVKLELYFDNKWIMLSEVSFKSSETDPSNMKAPFDEIIDNHDNAIGSEGLIGDDAQNESEANSDPSSESHFSGDLPSFHHADDVPVGGGPAATAGAKGVNSKPIESVRNSDHQADKREGSNQMFIGLVIGVLGVTVVLLIVTILIMYK